MKIFDCFQQKYFPFPDNSEKVFSFLMVPEHQFRYRLNLAATIGFRSITIGTSRVMISMLSGDNSSFCILISKFVPAATSSNTSSFISSSFLSFSVAFANSVVRRPLDIADKVNEFIYVKICARLRRLPRLWISEFFIEKNK